MRRWDHPRGCGEQLLGRLRFLADVGPSPRVRGAALSGAGGPRDHGTIPAGAGSRGVRRCSPQEQGDHPRGCGEQGAEGSVGEPHPGPSPRVRGADSLTCMFTVGGAHFQQLLQIPANGMLGDNPRRGVFPAGSWVSRSLYVLGTLLLLRTVLSAHIGLRELTPPVSILHERWGECSYGPVEPAGGARSVRMGQA